jgi:iron complex outermembrane receptor protein
MAMGLIRKSRGISASRPQSLSQVVSGILLLAGAASVVAQEAPATANAPADSGGLAEIVVTAERRSENIQNVPIAVTAFTAEALQSRNLVDIHALSNLSPGVNLDSGAPFSGDRSVLSASIRGIGQDDFAFNLQPAVGVYLDGVYLARTIGANQSLLDVDRVEILKGPQGTLFGANTEGGAISIITHTPGNEQKFTAQVTGGSLDRRDFGFSADIPIIKDVLLSSITVSSQDRDGYVKAVPYPTDSPYGSSPFVVDPQNVYPKAAYQTSDNYGGYNVQTIRGKMLWNVNDKMSMTFTADWGHEDQTALPYTVLNTYTGNLGVSTFSTLYNTCISNSAASLPAAIQANGGPPTFVGANALFVGNCTSPRARVPGLSIGGAPLVGAGYVGGPAGPYNYATYLTNPSAYLGTQQPRIWDSFAASNTGNIDTTYANGPDFARFNNFGGSITGVYNLTDDMAVKSITGYRQIRWDIGTDLDGTPETLQEVTDQQHQWQVSQEFQLTGKAFENRLNYVAGLYYFEEAGYVHDFVPFESLLYVYDFQNDVNNKNEAAFFHADYKVTDQFGVTVGGRYTDVQAEFIGGQGDLNNFPVGGGTPLRYFPPGDNSQSWHIFDPTFGAQYHITPDVMTYISWGKGFKAGGWTTRLSKVIDSGNQAEFAPEYSKTWEVGLKSTWFDQHLRANAALFYTDYSNIQLNIQEGPSPVYQNAGNAKIKGGELELQAALGHGFNLNFAGSYIDAYYTYVNPLTEIPQAPLPIGDGTVVAFDPLSAKLPKTPKYKLSLFPEYNYSLPNDATVRLLADFTYTAMMYNDALNTPLLRRPASRMFDASVHYVSPDNMYDVAFGGTNLTNDRYITVGSPNYAAGEVGGTYNEPREWYLQITMKMGGR